jgi:hypothetical protein
MYTVQKNIQNIGSSFGKTSTHPLRQQLIDHSKSFQQTKIQTFYIKFYQGSQYFNLDLSQIAIRAHNYIEANVIMHDYFNVELKTKFVEDQYAMLNEILEDDYEDNYDENGNLIISETHFDENDTLWLEGLDDEGEQREITLVTTFVTTCN